jgi:hypothetical protein
MDTEILAAFAITVKVIRPAGILGSTDESPKALVN